MVGSTRNQWPIIIRENTDEISKTGIRLFKVFILISLRNPTLNDMNDRDK